MTEGDEPLYITQGDIRQVQLAKGAILSGFMALMKRAGIGMEDLDKVLIAGQFGAHLPAASITGTGILPFEVEDRIQYVGNTSKTGAYMALMSQKVKREMEELAHENAPVFVDVVVTRGEGDLAPWWAKFAALASEHPEVKILVERDRRETVAPGAALEDIASADGELAKLDEMAIARARLAEENLTDADRRAFAEMLADVIAEVKAGGDESDTRRNEA